MSLLSFGALAMVLYFGWALVDPVTLKEVEDRVAHAGSASFSGGMPSRIRNGVGLLIGAVLLVTSLYRDLRPVARAVRRQETAVVRPLTAPAVQDPKLFDRIDSATLQRQIERQQATSRSASP